MGAVGGQHEPGGNVVAGDEQPYATPAVRPKNASSTMHEVPLRTGDIRARTFFSMPPSRPDDVVHVAIW